MYFICLFDYTYNIVSFETSLLYTACDANCWLCDRNEDCLECLPDFCYDGTDKVCRGKQK